MRIEKTYRHGISGKRIFKGVIISLTCILMLSFIFNYYSHLLDDYYSEEPSESTTVSEIDTSEKKEVYGTSFQDEEVIAGYKEELQEYIDEVHFSVLIVDGIFKLLGEDILKTKEYTETLNELSTNCIFSTYPFNKENIPSSELLGKVEKIEQLSASFCKDLKDGSELTLNMLDTDDFDLAARDLEKVRELNSVAYNKSLLIDQFCAEIEASLKQ